MASYLFVDVDTLLLQLRKRGISIDLYELASRLRNGAALAAGLANTNQLIAVAIANWDNGQSDALNVEQVFVSSGFKLCSVSERAFIGETLRATFLEPDPSINELIIATHDSALLSALEGTHLLATARVRVWGDAKPISGTPPDVIFQPLETILGFQDSTVALYIDFENITISLDKQGYTVNLEHLIARFVHQAQARGQIIKMAAYAPWGQRGTLPPLVDNMGREITDEASSRLALANIDPVFNLPGKNSADMRIAKDVLADLMYQDAAADFFILASGDRDFNEVINTLRAHNKHVLVWGVRGSVSRQLETNPAVQVEYIEDFTALQPHNTLGNLYTTAVEPEPPSIDVRPSQWVSAILQFDRIATGSRGIEIDQLAEQLIDARAVASSERATDLIAQALEMKLFLSTYEHETLWPNPNHPLVQQTRLVRDRIMVRVANTLEVRGWEYVNYGFLLKGIAMDYELTQPDLNLNDQWRSEWIDCLVREGFLQRDLVPHRHNPDDLVPVIKLSESTMSLLQASDDHQQDGEAFFGKIDENDLWAMQRRIVVSVEQFTSFRGFLWCPLGKLHRRLRAHDPGVVFQRAVDDLVEQGVVAINEYENPQSSFKTKGISLIPPSPLVIQIMHERDIFVQTLLALYNRHEIISHVALSSETQMDEETLALWLSIMEDENVINALPGRHSQYSLFRTHHTVLSVAETN